MYTKREKILSVILVLILAALVMAATIQPSGTNAVIWGHVQVENTPEKGTGTCGGRNYYAEPCPGCAVWLEWAGSPPSEYLRNAYAFRLDGTVYTDDINQCQVMLVTNYAICPGTP